MKFSIIVPIYNVEPYLERCVNSLLLQTCKDVEIILVDDESPDKCPILCDKYAAEDTRVRVIHKKNGGLSDARNAGLKIATGEYIIFVDSDDYLEITACEELLKYTGNSADVILVDAIVEGGNVDFGHINFSKIISGEEYLLEAYRQNKAPMAAWLNVYRRKFLNDNKLEFQYGILHEDEEFTPRVLLKATTVVCSNISMYHYIIRNNSITTKKDKRKNARDFYNTCRKLESIYMQVEDRELRRYLLDSLTTKYLSIFQAGQLYQYGKEYLHKDFVIKHAMSNKTKLKAVLYYFSPQLYYFINNVSKTRI